MKYLMIIIFLCQYLLTPAYALELEAPAVPESGISNMPDSDSSFSDGLLQIFKNVITKIRPDISEASSVCVSIICCVLIVSLVQTFHSSSKFTAEFAGALAVSATLFMGTNSLIQLGSATICELSEYGKLLFPVMTTALAAQGGVASSAAIYTGTSVFSAIAGSFISKILLSMVYFYLALSAANSAIGEEFLKNMRDLFKQLINWSLKILLTIFTTYISITGVVSGATDAATLKATKVTISSFVPVVGGILSDASEAVLVSMSVAKNAAGIYGIFAILAVFLEPFLRIGLHYILLKATNTICSIFGAKRICDLVADFSTAMGFILAMVGTVCVIMLISTVCFMKGVA